MAFQQMSVRKAITEIDEKRIFLPSIQRELVWNAEQITKLFDSLMCDYPISSFLFWEVKKDGLNKFNFYEFLREYSEFDNKDKHNQKADLKGKDRITAVLDGQQRLTALNIGLKGSFAYREPHKQRGNPNAYPKRKLYLNLLPPAEDSECKYEFEFLTEKGCKNDDTHYWFLVGDILNMGDIEAVTDYFLTNIQNKHYSDEQCKFANKALSRLHKIIHVSEVINFYLEESDSLDKVLQIFIRINSGGVKLSYSDLLLSMATAQWDKLDAREIIHNFVDEINRIGSRFNVTKDFILKACLVLCDFSDIAFKVDNFKRENVLKIQNEWESIADAIRGAVKLVASFGFSRDNNLPYNLFIPIAYYLKRIGSPSGFDSKSATLEDRNRIKKWFIRSLLRGGLRNDTPLRQMRETIRECSADGHFPLKELIEVSKKNGYALVFTEDEVNNMLDKQYRDKPMDVMSILYPWVDMKNHFHIDHMYPQSKMSSSKYLKERGLSDEEIKFAKENCNNLGNLQLLGECENIEKNNCDFDEWLRKMPAEVLADYKSKNLIPDIEPTYANFQQFLEARKKLIFEKLKKELSSNPE